MGLSRVRDPSCVKIVNFQPAKCPPQPQEVLDHISPSGLPVPTDPRRCCLVSIPQVPDPLDDVESNQQDHREAEDEIPSDDEFNLRVMDHMDNIDNENLQELERRLQFTGEPEHLTITSEIVTEITSEFVDMFEDHDTSLTDLLAEGQKALNLEGLNLEEHITQCWNTTAQILEAAVGDVTTKHEQADLTLFTTRWHKWLLQEHPKNIKTLFKTVKPSQAQLLVASHLASIIKLHVMERACAMISQGDEDVQESYEVTEESYKVIRHLAGRSIAKVRKSLMREITKKTEKGKPACGAEMAVGLLQTCCEQYDQIRITTKYPTSLEYTERRQNTSRGLTHVSDSVFEFILELERTRRLHQNFSELTNDPSNILIRTRNACIESDELKSLWSKCTTIPQTIHSDDDNSDLYEKVVSNLYLAIVINYLNVTDSGFKKSACEKLGCKKELNHRHSVKVDDLAEEKKNEKQPKEVVSESTRNTRTRKNIPPPQNIMIGPAQYDTTDAEDEQIELPTCAKCNKTIVHQPKKIAGQRFTCTRCLNVYHATCQGMKFWKPIYKARDEVNWICLACIKVAKSRKTIVRRRKQKRKADKSLSDDEDNTEDIGHRSDHSDELDGENENHAPIDETDELNDQDRNENHTPVIRGNNQKSGDHQNSACIEDCTDENRQVDIGSTRTRKISRPFKYRVDN